MCCRLFITVWVTLVRRKAHKQKWKCCIIKKALPVFLVSWWSSSSRPVKTEAAAHWKCGITPRRSSSMFSLLCGNYGMVIVSLPSCSCWPTLTSRMVPDQVISFTILLVVTSGHVAAASCPPWSRWGEMMKTHPSSFNISAFTTSKFKTEWSLKCSSIIILFYKTRQQSNQDEGRHVKGVWKDELFWLDGSEFKSVQL